MPGYAVISREEAAKQQADLQPRPAPEATEAPKRAVAGSHPAAPIESDPEALAAYQGRDKVEARTATAGSWHENAFGQPVFVLEETGGGGGRASVDPPGTPNEVPEDRPQQPPRAEEKPSEEKPSRGRG